MKKTTTKKAAVRKNDLTFEPGKVSLAVACLAAVSILWLAIMGVTS